MKRFLLPILAMASVALAEPAADQEAVTPVDLQAALQQLTAQLDLGDEPAAAPSYVQNAVPAERSTGLGQVSLTTSSLQPSTGISGAHLAGYPALPNTPPTSSIPNPTAADLALGRAMAERIREQKKFYQQHPQPYYR